VPDHQVASDGRLDTKAIQRRLPRRMQARERKEARELLRHGQTHEWMQKHSRHAVPRTHMSNERLESLRKCFDSLDVDGSGDIDRSELASALKLLGFPQVVVNAVLNQGDANGDGELSFAEFAALVAFAIAVERQPNKANRSFGAREARSVNEVATQAESFPFGLIANGNRITRLVNERDPEAREAARLQEAQERQEMARAHELGVPRRCSCHRGSCASAFGDGSSPLPVRGAGEAKAKLPAIRHNARRRDVNPEETRQRQRLQALDRLGEVGELEARRRVLLGPVFRP